MKAEFETVEDADEQVEKIRDSQDDEQTSGGHFAKRRSREGQQTGCVAQEAEEECQWVTELIDSKDKDRIGERCYRLIRWRCHILSIGALGVHLYRFSKTNDFKRDSSLSSEGYLMQEASLGMSS